MLQVITAPKIDVPYHTSVFLAGGISKCPNWQNEVIQNLVNEPIDATIFNPRCENFDIEDPTATEKQIEWEFRNLERMDIFSMYFCAGESDQPICMYELGRNIVRMQNRFPSDWLDRIVISVEKGYKREKDVIEQMKLVSSLITVNTDANPKSHAWNISNAVNLVKPQERI